MTKMKNFFWILIKIVFLLFQLKIIYMIIFIIFYKLINILNNYFDFLYILKLTQIIRKQIIIIITHFSILFIRNFDLSVNSIQIDTSY